MVAAHPTAFPSPYSTVSAHLKRAGSSPGDVAAELARGANSALRSDALKDVLYTSLGSLGLGAAARGAVGLVNLLRDNKPKRELRHGPAELPFPLPTKQAGFGDFLAGTGASGKWAIPWYGAGMFGGGVASGALGWHAVDSLMKDRRKSEREDELEKARHAFRTALLAQHDDKDKQAAEGEWAEAGRELDRQFQQLEKQAEWNWQDIPGGALSAYGAYALPMALLSGMAGYNHYQKNSRRTLLEKAMRERKRQQAQEQPAEIYAVPVPHEGANKAAAVTPVTLAHQFAK